MINIVNKNECMGCHGCYNICPKNCIEMKVDVEGFKYPHINLQECIKCNLCEKVCAILNDKKVDNNPRAYACYNKDEIIRGESSSGGIFSLVAEKILNDNGVIFGACFNEKLDVIHTYTANIKEIKKFRGSKYVQSNIGESYSDVKKFLEKGKKVLFTGTPCQISGLKRYLQKDYKNLFCMDIICHGVPSPKSWIKFRNSISNEKKITNINFRNKSSGWKSYCFSIEFDDKSELKINRSENKYMDGFIGDIFLRPSCHECRFKSLNRESDITLADFWGIENIKPEMDDDKGTSLIFVNSIEGKKMINKIIDFIRIQEVDINEAIKYNISAIKSSYCNPRRKYFFKNIDKMNFDKLVVKSLMDPLHIRIKVIVIRVLKYVQKLIKGDKNGVK